MNTKTVYEEEILKEIQDMPEALQERMAKIIHMLKKEITNISTDEEHATTSFLSVCGAWEDDRSIEEQIRDIYSCRVSSSRTEKAF